MATKEMKNVESFLLFLMNHLHMDISKIPSRVPRKLGAHVGGWVIPPFRFTSDPLIPAADYYPCDLCEFARYNALCSLQSNCAPHAFWSMQKLEQLESATPRRARAAIIRHLGLKVRRPKNEPETREKKARSKARKQGKGKRVADNRSATKPVSARKEKTLGRKEKTTGRREKR